MIAAGAQLVRLTAHGLTRRFARTTAAVGGKYLLDQPSWHGFDSSIFRARDLSGGGSVLLKVFPSLPLAERAWWLAQAERWSRQVNPHLARIVDYGCEPDGRCFLVTEPRDGRSLRQALRERGPLSPPQVVSLLRQLCQALSGPHQAGLVHRSLDPDHLLICRRPGGDEQLVVIGFGRRLCARASCFVAPEQLVSSATDTSAVDLYAMGAIACQLLAGVISLPARLNEELQRRSLQGLPTVAEAQAPGLGQIISECLAADPLRRPRSVAALALRLAGSRASATDDLRGTRAGSYQLLHPLGEGGLGSVWLAENPEIGARAAVKVAHSALGTVSALAGRFRREAEAVNRVSSPHLIRIFDYGRLADGREYITMEVLEGETLAARMKRHSKLSWPLVRKIALQLAAGLATAHAAGVVHRDVKPQNVQLSGPDDEPQVKLFDFGIAKLIDGSVPKNTVAADQAGSCTSAGVFLGTPRYASPEQLLGGAVGTASDVYSLGLVLVELLRGDEALGESCHSKHALSAALLCASEPELRLIAEMLRDAPAQRPSMIEVLRRLQELPAHTSTSASDTPAPAAVEKLPDLPQSQDWRRRPLALGAALAAVLALALLAVGLGVRRFRHAARPAVIASQQFLRPYTLRSEPSGAEVRLGGVPLGTTPLSLRLERGLPELQLLLSKPGYGSQTFRLLDGEEEQIIRLRRAPPLAAAKERPAS